MSKIGQQIILVPAGVTVTLGDNLATIKGPKGELNVNLSKDLEVKNENNEISIKLKKDNKVTRSLWGTTRMLIANSIKGVTEGWKKQLELVGTGYRSEVQGTKLVLTVGYSHPIIVEAPEGITFKVEKSVINVDGIDKQVVGQVSAVIRSSRPPEPYKGKGVKYVGEVIRRKAGKAAKAAA
jgi:large subunit ribosomal protein L6